MDITQEKEETWEDYGKCHICRFLSVEKLGTDEAPIYYCRVCKTRYSKYSQ